MTTAVQSPATLTPAASAFMAPAVLDATDAQLARLREFLSRAGFTFGELFTRGEQARVAGRDVAKEPDEVPLDAGDLSDVVGVLRALFVGARPVPAALVRERIAPDDLALLDELRLLRAHDVKADHVLGSVLICPIAGLWLLSDHPYVAQGERWPADVVYSPLTRNTQHFMLTMSRQPCDALLELCSGSGVAALAAARHARETVGVDITGRSTRFAEVNARLNGITNAQMLEGDLYAPVRGRTFDRIVAHPPYMPAFEQEFVFRDGGADGEQITRRIIEGLPDYLRPGGRAFLLCLATDRTTAPLEQRVREWLGVRQDDFDVLLVEMQPPRDPTEFYAHRAYDQGGGFAEVEPRHRFFKEHQVASLVYVAIHLQRRAHDRPVFTARRKQGLLTASTHMDWAFAWETASAAGALTPLLPALPARMSPDARMSLVYRPGDEGFELEGCTLVVETPLAFEVSVPAWVPRFLERTFTPTPLAEMLPALHRDQVLPPDVTLERFTAAVRDLAATGVVLFPGFEPPPADGQLGRVLDAWRTEQPTALDRLAAQSG